MTEADCPLLPVVGAELTVPLTGGSRSRYINLDYAASTPALDVVAQRITEALPLYASVHRGAGYASQVSTAAYENARAVVGRFVGARQDDLVVFTRNTTDSLNLLSRVVPGETVYLDIEHHANLLPWAAAKGRLLAAGSSIEQTLRLVDDELTARPAALLAVTGASNVTGELLPLRALATIVHRHGTRLAVDGAQLVPHRRIQMALEGVDFLAFSGHKTYAPFGAGVLVGSSDWLNAGEPYLRGGGAVTRVTASDATWQTGPARHEAGSPNVLGALGLARALEALAELDQDAWADHEAALRNRLSDGLAAIPGVSVHRMFDDSTEQVGVVSFSVDGVDAGLLAVALSAEYGIGVRDGRFCAHPLMDRLGLAAPALRASVGVGSRLADVEALLDAVAAILAHGPAGEYERVDGQWQPTEDSRPRPEWAPSLDAKDAWSGCAA